MFNPNRLTAIKPDMQEVKQVFKDRRLASKIFRDLVWVVELKSKLFVNQGV